MSASGRSVADLPTKPRPHREVARWVLEVEAAAVQGLLPQLDEAFDQAVDCILQHRGRVVCAGMGKSGLILRKVAATLASTGTPSLFLHPAEAIHGDLGMITEDDVVLAASYSGTTEELLRLVELVKRLGVPLIVLTGNGESPLAKYADIHLPVAIDKEACPLNLAPTASTTATLALADALSMALLEARGFTPEDFARRHPGGQLGRRLMRVDEVMHHGEALPRVGENATLGEAIVEMSAKTLGITAVVDDEGRLLGCLTDGDLRRMLTGGDVALRGLVADSMHRGPHSIARDRLASEALRELEDHRITSVFVTDSEGRLEGIVHIHDLWRLELF